MAAPRCSNGGAETVVKLGAKSQAARAMQIVLALWALNIVVDLAMRMAGLVVSLNSALPLEDMFSDYFRFVVSYPGGDRIGSHVAWLARRLSADVAGNPPPGVEGLKTGHLTHFNAPPVTTLIALVNLQAMRWIEPALLYGAVCLALLGYWWAIVRRFAAAGERGAWLALGVVSYPAAMVLVRGNVYAGWTGLLIVHALLLAPRAESPRLAAILLALAVGMRPNAIVFAAPLFLLQTERWAALRTLALAVPTISGAALIAAHAIYPDYTPATFLAGVQAYYVSFVEHHLGIAWGSSLFGALVLLFGAQPGLQLVATIAAGAIGMGAVLLRWTGRIALAPFLFLVCAAYCLGSSVIADYHLFVFVLPILVPAGAGERLTAGERVAFVASALMLAPKNYLFDGDISVQPLLNPLILLVASGAILGPILGRLRGRPLSSLRASPA